MLPALLLLLSCPAPHSAAVEVAAAPVAVEGTRILRRHALLVGNGAYRGGSVLANPVRDVEALGDTLQGLGWEVEVAADLDRKGMREAVNAFSARLGPDDAALFYYAGHGVAIEGRNYLLPVDFDAETAADAQEEAYALDVVQEQLSSRPGGVSLIVTDACRNQPFTRSWSRSQIKGFVTPPPSANETFVAFSTQAGNEALDGALGAQHSPFAQALLEQLARPGLDVDDVFRGVKGSVYDATGAQQQPWTSDNLRQGFFFDGVTEAPAARLARAGTPASRAFRSVGGGSRAMGLLIAVGDYDELNDLHSESDIALMVPALESIGVAKADLAVLTGATGDQARAALDRIAEAAGPGDRVWVHYSGMARPARDGGALLLKDSPADGFAAGVTAPGAIPVEDLRRRLDLVRDAVGPTGAVTVTLDTNCVFDEVPGSAADTAPLTLVQVCDENGLNWEVRDAQGGRVGALSWLASEVVVNRAPVETWADLGVGMSRRLQAVNGDMAAHIEGDAAVEVGSGARTSTLPLDSTRSYGAFSVFLSLGRLDGVYAGAEVALPNGKRGTVVQTGVRGARVELDPASSGSKERGIVAAALPPGTSVGASPDLAERMGPIGISAAVAALRWVGETNYAVLEQGSVALSPPVPLGDAAALARWSYASAWRADLGVIAAKSGALEWAPIPDSPDSPIAAPTRGARVIVRCADGAATLEAGVRGFRFQNGPDPRHLVLMVLAADGDVTRLYDRDVPVGPGSAWTSCAALEPGDGLVAVATATPWSPDTLVRLLSEGAPYERIARSRPEEMPRGRSSGASLTTLDDPDDAAEIDAIWVP